jgi:serine/threonine protein kinase
MDWRRKSQKSMGSSSSSNSNRSTVTSTSSRGSKGTQSIHSEGSTLGKDMDKFLHLKSKEPSNQRSTSASSQISLLSQSTDVISPRDNDSITNSDYVEHEFAKRWEVEKVNLAEGGFGKVHLMKNRKTGILAAAKCTERYRIGYNDYGEKQKFVNEDCLNAARIEIDILRSLRHPNIVNFIDYFEEEKGTIMMMEYLSGGELLDRVIAKSTYSERDARDLIYIFLKALKFCHDHDVVHRDIKPENLMLVSEDDDSLIKLIDFGLSRRLPKGQLCYDFAHGTEVYKAPEWINRQGYGKSVDMWAAGCLAFILLCGEAPFDHPDRNDRSETRFDVAHQQIRKGAHRMGGQYKRVSPEAKDLISGLLCVDVETRLTVDQALEHPWVNKAAGELAARNLDKSLKILTASRTKKFKSVVHGVIFQQRLGKLGSGSKKRKVDESDTEASIGANASAKMETSSNLIRQSSSTSRLKKNKR